MTARMPHPDDGTAASWSRSCAIARSAASAVALLMLFSASAFAAGKVSAKLQGPSIYDDGYRSESGPEAVGIQSSGVSAGRGWRGFASAAKAEATSEMSVNAVIMGTSRAFAEAEARSSSIQYVLRPPEGARFASGKIVIYGGLVGVNVEGSASLRIVLDVEAALSNGESRIKWADRTLKEQPGNESVEFYVAMPLPAALDSTRDIPLLIATVLEAAARIDPAADGSGQASWVRADDPGSLITGFEVLDSSGAQVRGFTMTGASGLVIPERAPPKPGNARAIEFYHRGHQNFFVTANPGEIASLDEGATDGWQRSGESFNVYTGSSAGTVGICRFYTDKFKPDFAHAYAAQGPECDALMKDPVWKYEGVVFFMPLPAADGTCPVGHRQVFRLYNDGMDGAPSHRLTTRTLTRLGMIADDWAPEGYGPGVAMCSPI